MSPRDLARFHGTAMSGEPAAEDGSTRCRTNRRRPGRRRRCGFGQAFLLRSCLVFSPPKECLALAPAEQTEAIVNLPPGNQTAAWGIAVGSLHRQWNEMLRVLAGRYRT